MFGTLSANLLLPTRSTLITFLEKWDTPLDPRQEILRQTQDTLRFPAPSYFGTVFVESVERVKGQSQYVGIAHGEIVPG